MLKSCCSRWSCLADGSAQIKDFLRPQDRAFIDGRYVLQAPRILDGEALMAHGVPIKSTEEFEMARRAALLAAEV